MSMLPVHLIITFGIIFMGGKEIFTRKEKGFFDFLRIKKIPLFLIPLLLLESILLLISASFVNAWSEIFFENTMESTLESAASNPVISVLGLCLLPAVFEEILFRGAIMRSYSNPPKGLVISAVLFSIWHLNPNQMSYTFLAGLLLALTALWTDNLVCSMIIHFLFNLYNVLAAALPASSIGGRAIIALEKLIIFLLPQFYTSQGVFILKNFLASLVTFLICIGLFVGILWWVRNRAEQQKQ